MRYTRNTLHMYHSTLENSHVLYRCKMVVEAVCTDGCEIHSCNPLYCSYIHHHVHEGLGVFPAPSSSKWSWSLRLFFGRPMFLRPFGLYCSVCFGILLVSILCTCCSHLVWYCFIYFTKICAPVFSLIHWFFSLSNFVIPSKCLKNFICAASKRFKR